MLFIEKNPNVTNWSLENGYSHGININEYPRRVTGSGKGSGFDISLQMYTKEFDRNCKGVDKGFSVILTQPGDPLKMSNNAIRVPHGENCMITIKPKLTVTSVGLRNYAPSQRQCFYQTERQLRFFKVYTQSNCEEECLANYTKKECGCVNFAMPSMFISDYEISNGHIPWLNFHLTSIWNDSFVY